MDNLDEFLNGNEPEAEAVVVEAPEVETAEVETESAEAPPVERPRGPDGKFIPKGEAETPQEVASPAAEEPKLEHPALIGERRRRQEAEAQLEQMRAEIARMQQPQPQPQVQQTQQIEPLPEVHPAFGPRPDEWEDRPAYDAWVAAIVQERAEQRAYGRFQTSRIATSTQQFAPTVSDYTENVQAFQRVAQANPALLQGLYNAANPAEYAYKTGKIHLGIERAGGLESYIAQEAAKMAGHPSQTITPTPTSPPIPDTLADAQSSRGSSESFTPPTLDQILGRAA